MRGVAACYILTRARLPNAGRVGSPSTVAAAGDPVAAVVTDTELLVVKLNLGSGEEEGCVRLQNLLELWRELA